jgi:hypothetical protein
MDCYDSPRRNKEDCLDHSFNDDNPQMIDPNKDSEFEEFKNFYEFDTDGQDVALPNEKKDVIVYKRDFPRLYSDMFRQKVIYNIGEQSLSVLKKHKMLSKLYNSLMDQNILNTSEDEVLQKVLNILEDCDNSASQINHVFLQNSKNNLYCLCKEF